MLTTRGTSDSKYRMMQRLAFITLLSVLVLVISAKALAGTLTRGYEAETDLPSGAVVSVTSSNGNAVEKTTTTNDSLIAGVIVGSNDSLLDVLPKGSQVRVGIEGEVKMLVSDINGNIKKGDKLIASPLAGIAADDSPPAPGAIYIGVASQDFDGSSGDAKKITVNLSEGGSKEVSVGLITAKMLIGNRSQNEKGKNIITTIGSQIGGKDVSLLQVLAASAIFLTAAGLCGILLYGSIKGTFVSLGRNPLSRDSLLVGLARVLVLAVVVIAGGAAIAYFVLTL